MIKDFGRTHTIATCKDCDWHSESHINGQALAAKHAKAHKHYVLVEYAIAGYYDGREAPDGE